MRNTNNALVKGSLSEVARSKDIPVAELYLDLKAVLVVDVSGSMSDRDARDNQRRIDVAQAELNKIQAELPGQLAIIAFSSDHNLCPNGVLPEPNGGTNLAGALTYVKKFDDLGVRIVCVSDGLPDSEDKALTAGKALKSRLDTIYVGPETGGGREFLRRLAHACHGKSDNIKVGLLADSVRKLLTAG